MPTHLNQAELEDELLNLAYNKPHKSYQEINKRLKKTLTLLKKVKPTALSKKSLTAYDTLLNSGYQTTKNSRKAIYKQFLVVYKDTLLNPQKKLTPDSLKSLLNDLELSLKTRISAQLLETLINNFVAIKFHNYTHLIPNEINSFALELAQLDDIDLTIKSKLQLILVGINPEPESQTTPPTFPMVQSIIQQTMEMMSLREKTRSSRQNSLEAKNDLLTNPTPNQKTNAFNSWSLMNSLGLSPQQESIVIQDLPQQIIFEPASLEMAYYPPKQSAVPSTRDVLDQFFSGFNEPQQPGLSEETTNKLFNELVDEMDKDSFPLSGFLIK